MIKYLLKNSIFNFRMLGLIILISLVLFFELCVNESFFSNYLFGTTIIDAQSLVCNVFALSIFTQLAGLFPGIAFGFSLLDERNSGFLKYELIRSTPMKYIKQKIFFTGLSGAITMIVPYIFLLIPVSFVGVGTTKEYHTAVLEKLAWGSIMYEWNGYLLIALKGVLLILFGIMWAELTLLISLFVKNRYVAFIIPYIIYELLFFLNWKNGILMAINPRYMLRYDVGNEYPLILPFFMFIIYIALLDLIILIVFRKQVKDGKC